MWQIKEVSACLADWMLTGLPAGNATLFLGSVMPHYEFSYAPLTQDDGTPVALPDPGDAGFAYQLSDQHILTHSNFDDFPQTALTVEFWIWSIDR